MSAHEVEVIASLPCYLRDKVDAQRGAGVFEKSIAALRKLNAVGYGTRPPLDLVFNPLGATLPPPQGDLEADYKVELRQRYGIEFTRLFTTITNQPIARLADDLRFRGQWDAYLEVLANSFNPATWEGVMCRSTLSVGWMCSSHTAPAESQRDPKEVRASRGELDGELKQAQTAVAESTAQAADALRKLAEAQAAHAAQVAGLQADLTAAVRKAHDLELQLVRATARLESMGNQPANSESQTSKRRKDT